MVFNHKYPFIQILLIITIGLGEEFRFPLSSDHPVTFKDNHWQHPASNSTMDINGIGVDVFQWRAAAESLGSVKVDLINPVWEYAGLTNDNIVLPKSITISEVSNFRGTPTIYIKVTPWRTIGNGVEVLTGGAIKIWIDPPNFPITYSHSHLLNGKMHQLQRSVIEETQYLIICPNEFADAAQYLAYLHTNLVDSDFLLNTDFVTVEEITESYSSFETEYAIRQFLLDSITSNDKLDFLLLLGDETNIPPIFYNNNTSEYPSDDFYTTNNIFDDPPQLFTGRIPVSTLGDANTVVNKIYDYIITPTSGIWRSKVALVADDMRKDFCSIDEDETTHTTYTQELYDTLKTLLPVLPFYGVHYNLHPCEYPDLTRDLIQTINNGVALINYIGHGDPESWAHEKFIDKSRDLPLIHPGENRLAIWVAGTCSFGDYYGQDSFMEDLMIKEDGAIAVIATTDKISVPSNWNYIKHFFGLDNEYGLEDYINDNKDLRLGELAGNVKTSNDYRFHTFGDPALPLPFPKKETDLIINPPDTIHLVQEEYILFDISEPFSHSSILIRDNEKKYLFYFDRDSSGFPVSDTLEYTVSGETYVQMDISGSSTCFRIPVDASSCNDCVVIQAYQENTGWYGRMETIPNISLFGSVEDFVTDSLGPVIFLSQGTRNATYGSTFFTNIDITVSLKDESGINLIETDGHGISYEFDDNGKVVVSGNEFIYTDCGSGYVTIPVPLSLSDGKHELYLQAWDGLNNQSDTLIYLDLLPPVDEDRLNLYKVYPIPNPFSKSTNLTMISTHFPVDIIINIYSLNGLNVQTLNKSIISINDCFETYSEDDGCFINIAWDGKDRYGSKISNGAYFYHVKAKTNNNLHFESIYKLAKIE